ncbi:MAG: RDD family protein [Campylobacterota bacterium]|nr:RDD family protein [Campylobacterota bacterium]
MARWRDAKKGNIKPQEKTKSTKDNNKDTTFLISASPLFRIKAFITDMFMIMMPIMYLTTYVVMDGAESFKGSDNAHWVTMTIYGLITVLFWVKKGQTPGFKAYDLRIIDDNTKKPLSYPLAIARYLMFIFSAVSIVGVLLPFFRKDKKTLQDILLQTSVVRINS